VSRVLERTDDFATTVTGTPYYMAPEAGRYQPITFSQLHLSRRCLPAMVIPLFYLHPPSIGMVRSS